MINRKELLKVLATYRKDELVVYTMSSAKEWPLYSESPLNFYVAGAMGYASSIGLGLALAQPRRRVWVLDGDGSLLMNLGTLVTIADQMPPNLIHFVLNNGLYELPGWVPIPGCEKVSLSAFAKAANMRKVYEYSDSTGLSAHLDWLLREVGPVFVNFKVAPGPREPLGGGNALSRAEDMAKAMEQALRNV